MKPNTGERDPRGFSLVELLVVLIILGILASLAISALYNARDKAKQRATMADMRTISKAIELYNVDHGRIPDGNLSLEDLQALLVPYETSVLPIVDHWHNDYDYKTQSDNYSLESFGRDGVDGLNITVATKFEFDRDIILSNGRFVASPE